MVFDCAVVCNTRLSLSLDNNLHFNRNDPQDGRSTDHQEMKSKPSSASAYAAAKSDDGNCLPSLTLALPSDQQHRTLNMDPKGADHQLYSSTDHLHGRQQASSGSAVSSFSNSSVKREAREVSGGDHEEVEEERISAKNIADQEQDEEGPRKKLRLTKEQSLVLEDSFKEHSTLNPVIFPTFHFFLINFLPISFIVFSLIHKFTNFENLILDFNRRKNKP